MTGAGSGEFSPSSGRSTKRAPRLSQSSTTRALPHQQQYRTAQLLDDPVIWATIKALARFIQDSELKRTVGCLRRAGDGLL